jgi:hypothetical protein
MSVVARIHGMSGTGRLSVRNTVRMGTIHLYFEHGRLVHVQGTRATADELLVDLAGWKEGLIRFDVGVVPEHATATPEHEKFFQQTLLLLQQRGVIASASRPLPPNPLPDQFSPKAPPEQQPAAPTWAMPGQPPRLPERPTSFQAPVSPPGGYRWGPGQAYSGQGNSGPNPRMVVPATLPPLSLPDPLKPSQWDLLVEVVRALLEDVGQLFGRRQAQNILRNVLAEQSEELPVLGLVQVDRDGWLRELRAGEMITQPRQQVAEGFVVLITEFERRCALLLGEERARQMISLALHDYQEELAELGIAVNSA